MIYHIVKYIRAPYKIYHKEYINQNLASVDMNAVLNYFEKKLRRKVEKLWDG